MSVAESPTPISQLTRACQIIVGTLVAGPCLFLAVVYFLGPQGAIPGTPILTYTALALGAIVLVTSVLVPRLVIASGRRRIVRAKTDVSSSKPVERDADLALIFRTQLIVGAALLEGACNFAVIVYLLERNLLAVGVTLALLIALIARFPTGSRVEQWFDAQRELILQERQFGEF